VTQFIINIVNIITIIAVARGFKEEINDGGAAEREILECVCSM